MHGSERGDTGKVGEGGGVRGAVQVGKRWPEKSKRARDGKARRSANLQSSRRGTWRLTQSPLELTTESIACARGDQM